MGSARIYVRYLAALLLLISLWYFKMPMIQAVFYPLTIALMFSIYLIALRNRDRQIIR